MNEREEPGTDALLGATGSGATTGQMGDVAPQLPWVELHPWIAGLGTLAFC